MAAGRAAVTAFNEKDQYPVESWGWDTYEARLNRYALYEAYYQNTVYSSLESFAAKLKTDRRLYRHIRGIYNPVARQNRMIRANVYPGSIDLQNLASGALPVETENQALIDPLKQIMKWSNLGRSLSLYVKWGALLGDVGLWIADDRDRQKVRIEAIHPSKIREAEFDESGNVKACVIEYVKSEPTSIDDLRITANGVREPAKASKEYTFTLKVNKERFQTYKNGEPFAFFNDADGNPVSEWDNPYGFVPLVIAHYEDSGLTWGENSFFTTQRKIDEINDAASLLNDSIRKVVIPLLKAKGIRKPDGTNANGSDLQFSQEERDQLLVAYLSKAESDLEPVIIPLDIAAAAGNVDRMLMELERDLPELALQRIREVGAQMTAPGIRTGFSDAIRRIQAAQQSLDPALISSLQMAVTMSSVSGYTGFTGFNLNSYAAGALDFDLKERTIIPDTIDKQAKITTLLGIDQKRPSLQKLVLKELEYSDTEVAQFLTDDQTAKQQEVAQVQAQQQANNRAAVRGWADSVFGNRVTNDAAPTQETQSVAS